MIIFAFYTSHLRLAFELFPKLLSKGLSALERQHKWSGDIINVNAVIPFPPLCQAHNNIFVSKFLYHYHLSSILQLQTHSLSLRLS